MNGCSLRRVREERKVLRMSEGFVNTKRSVMLGTNMWRAHPTSRVLTSVLWFGILLALSFPSVATNHQQLLDSAFAQFDDNFTEHWSYTETLTTSDGIMVGHYSPSRESPILATDDDRW